MEALFEHIAGYVALGCEFFAVILLGLGAVESAVGLLRHVGRLGDYGVVKRIWLKFATRIVLGLELTLAGDIVRTAILPTWTDIGQLAAIAAIRTVLNVFLQRDLAEYERLGPEATQVRA